MKSYRNLLLVLLMLPALTGCLAAAAAGGAAAGYYVGKDERTAGEIAQDAALSTKVKSKLIADTDVAARNIDVDVHRHVVILSGLVRSGAEKDRVIEIARTTDGVEKVVSYLDVDERS